MARSHGNSGAIRGHSWYKKAYKDHVISQVIVSPFNFFSFRAIAHFLPPLPRLSLVISLVIITPSHIALDMGVLVKDEVRDYAYDCLYSMLYLVMGQLSHIFTYCLDHMFSR